MSFDQTFPNAARHPLLIEQEIAHLVRIVPRWSEEGSASVLGQAYWRKRVIDLARFPELTPTQHAIVQRILERVNTAV
ncbi:hypothetical protein SAMN05414139_09323 [Burkholderia sp. D7]|nr:hypothetical protein SAMN05414139_09323 [Burkholderia sp. D7]